MTLWNLILVWFAPIAVSIGLIYFFTRGKDGLGESKAKPDYLSMIAHQFRTPLTSIKWISERLASSRLEQDQKDKVMEIQKINQHLIGLIENLQKIGQEKSNGIAEVKEYFLANLVGEIVGLFKSPAERKNIRIVLGVRPGVEKIKTDKMLLTEAMKNILENAIDYSPSNSNIEIDVDRSADRFLISITNYGEAIADCDKAHLCDKFFRGEIGKRSRAEGSGLGLFIAKAAIQANHGTISILSPARDGKGTSFVISLPAD